MRAMPGPCKAFKSVTVGTVALDVLKRPWSLVLAWNWKAGLLSGLFRAVVFAIAAGLHRPGAMHGLCIELTFRVMAGGLWGSLLQTFRTAQPPWLAGLGVVVVLPGSIHVLEFALLKEGHAAGIRARMLVSIAVSALSLLVNWGLMKRGQLLTGKGSGSLRTDFARLPALAAALFTGRRQTGAGPTKL
jgi:hypothetical protein